MLDIKINKDRDKRINNRIIRIICSDASTVVTKCNTITKENSKQKEGNTFCCKLIKYAR